MFEGADELAARARIAGCVFVGSGRRDRLRRLRRRLQPRAADRRRGPLRRPARPGHLPAPQLDRQPAERRGRGARARTSTRSPAPRAFPCTASPLRLAQATSLIAKMHAVCRHLTTHDEPAQLRSTARPARPRSRSPSTSTAATWTPRPASASSTTCSTCSAATAGSACGSRRSGDLETGAHHTVEDVGIALGQALDEALGDRAGIRRYGYAAVPMDEALGVCAIDISGRPLCLFRGRPAADLDRRLRRPSSTEEFFRAVATNAKLTLHLGTRYGTNAHHMIEACFKAFARALREAVVDRPGRARRAVDQGDADLTRHRRSSTTGWATCARSRRRSSASAPRASITGDPDAAREADGADPARASARSRGR